MQEASAVSAGRLAYSTFCSTLKPSEYCIYTCHRSLRFVLKCDFVPLGLEARCTRSAQIRHIVDSNAAVLRDR